MVVAGVVAGLGSRTYARNLDYQSEITLWRDAVSNYPTSYRAWAALGNAELAAGDAHAAIRDCDEAIRLNDESHRAYFFRGSANFLLGNKSNSKKYKQLAMHDFSKAIELHPDFVEAYAARSAVAGSLGKFDEALADANQAIQHGPGYAVGYLNRGHVLRERRDVASALQDFDRAIELSRNTPDAPEAYLARASLRVGVRDYQGAADDYTRLIELNPNDASAYKNRAVCWYQLRQTDKAWADVEQCEKLGGHPAPGFIQALRAATQSPPGPSSR